MSKAQVASIAAYRFISCRDLGHAWAWSNDFPQGKIKKNGRLVMERHLLCRTCGTGRRDTILFPSMEILGRSYTYSDGYEVPGRGRIRAATFRREALVQQGAL